MNAVRPTALRVHLGHLTLHALTWGAAARPPLLAIHGAGAHAHWWDPIVPHLGGRRRVIAPDLRGHGRSDWAARYLIEDFAGDLLALLDHCAPQTPVALVGHSMGGRVALWIAAHHAERVCALALLDARLGPIPAERVERWRSRRAADAPRRTYPTRAAAMAAFRLTPPEAGVAPPLHAALAEHAVRQGPEGTWQLCCDRAVLALDGSRTADLLPLLARVRCPTLVLRGTASTVIGESHSIAIAARLPAAQIEVVPGGHHFPLAHPGAVGRRLRDFLAATD